MNKGMIKMMAAGVLAAALGLADATAHPARSGNGAKYVIFLVGDGMASVQAQAAAAYLTHLNGGSEDVAADLIHADNVLNMRTFPVLGMATTFSDTRFITDSAAAATALACGIKTEAGVLGRNTAKNASYKSVAVLAHEKGKSVGIISSVSLPHATPAAFYAHVNSRRNYAEIGRQAAESGFEFFGGGKFRYLTSVKTEGAVQVQQAFDAAGYVTVTSIADAKAQNANRKLICSVPFSYGKDAMPYAIDSPPGSFSLAEVAQVALDRLAPDPQGFFLFVEGGKIDWAGHANDAAANINETLAFDQAVRVALDFYRAHPTETLVVVTGDHETGGMTLGYVGNKYQTAFDKMDGQTMSYEKFGKTVWADYKAATRWTDAETSNIDQTLKALIEQHFGLAWSDLSAYQQEQLEAAYDRSRGGIKADARPSGYDLDGKKDVDYLVYGGYDALPVTLCHILNQEAGITWTSSSHTGVPVPVMAIGFEAERFSGFYDNTDVAKKIGAAMRTQDLPVLSDGYQGALNY